MALEVIGGIASIAQLAGTVYTISKTLYEVGEALSNAPSDIKDLARDLETFSDELHLLSTLLHGKDGRYADQVYRLTAKIIGDCATICTKIDRIIRKLRSGSVWAKVKWLYKEKEIMKLLARLRDLKLSLMGTLSVLSALRADHMMDSLGIQNSSLIGGQDGHSLSAGTIKQVEETRLKLAGIKMIDTTKTCQGSKFGSTSSTSLLSGSSSSASNSSVTSATLIGFSASQIPSTSSLASSGFISMVTIPKSIPMLNPKAFESVDSFHSAISYQNVDSSSPVIETAILPTSLPQATSKFSSIDISKNTVAAVSSRKGPTSASTTATSQLDASPEIDGKSLQTWRNEMSILAMKHFILFPCLQSTTHRYPTENQQTDSNCSLPMTSSIPQELATSVYDPPIQQSIPHADNSFDETKPFTSVDLTIEHSANITPDDFEATGSLIPSTIKSSSQKTRKYSPTQNPAEFQAAMGFAGLDIKNIGLPLPSGENLELDRVAHEIEGASEVGVPCQLPINIGAQPKMPLRQLLPPPSRMSGTVFRTKVLIHDASQSSQFPTSPEYSLAEIEPSKLWKNQPDTELLPLIGQKKLPDNVPVPDEDTVLENIAYLNKQKGSQRTATNMPPRGRPMESLSPSRKGRGVAMESRERRETFADSSPISFSPNSQNLPVLGNAKDNGRNDWSDIKDRGERRKAQNRLAQRLFLERVKTDKERQDSYAESHPHARHSFNTSDLNKLSDDNHDDHDNISCLPWSSIQMSYQQQQQQQQRMQKEQQLQVCAETIAAGQIEMQYQSYWPVRCGLDRKTSSYLGTEHAQEVAFADESLALPSAEKEAKRRKGTSNTGRECIDCHTKSTPEWRRGPGGTRELCNNCGLKWAKPLRHGTKVGCVPESTCNSFGPPKSANHDIVTSSSIDHPRNTSTTSDINPHLDDKISGFSPHNKDNYKRPGELWIKGLKNLLSLSPILGSNLGEYLNRENVVTITGPNFLITNPDWSADFHKKNINASRQRIPDAASSIQRIFKVLDVMEETIGLKVGAIAWACLLSGVENILSPDIGLALQMRVEIASQIAQIASIVARYIVMENIYAQWKEMSLDKRYEGSLINFSTHVLNYFGELLSPTAEYGDEFSTKMKSYFKGIMYADEACRGFTVIFSNESDPLNPKRPIEDVSGDSDYTEDSYGTRGSGEKCGMEDRPSLAKRTRI
ncbi:hypothetical protein DID88_006474 [Monilinia fructigena]|uniref:GATA-type domain-containing protein n=1 Tax=Monilinia fructigena TaxID=38457 RepID=A0A395IGZ1_9HELO|nr:hypothetical protein DID88_006474 [Monilinia fructigena]